MTVLAALTAIYAGGKASTLESDQLEFKQADASLKRTLEIIADAVVCFANAEGGQIVLGVNDAGSGAAALVGVDQDVTVDVVLRGVFDRTRPALSVPVGEESFQGVRLLVVSVPKGAVFYANAKGTSTRRVGQECRPFPPEEQRQALASRGLYDWSAEATDTTLADADPDEVGRGTCGHFERTFGRRRRVLVGAVLGEQLARPVGSPRSSEYPRKWVRILFISGVGRRVHPRGGGRAARRTGACLEQSRIPIPRGGS